MRVLSRLIFPFRPPRPARPRGREVGRAFRSRPHEVVFKSRAASKLSSSPAKDASALASSSSSSRARTHATRDDRVTRGRAPLREGRRRGGGERIRQLSRDTIVAAGAGWGRRRVSASEARLICEMNPRQAFPDVSQRGAPAAIETSDAEDGAAVLHAKVRRELEEDSFPLEVDRRTFSPPPFTFRRSSRPKTGDSLLPRARPDADNAWEEEEEAFSSSSWKWGWGTPTRRPAAASPFALSCRTESVMEVPPTERARSTPRGEENRRRSRPGH